MKSRYKTIIIAGIATTLFVLISVGPASAWFVLHPCQLEFGMPKADALFVHQSVGQTYRQSEIVAVGTITESAPKCSGENIVTRMSLDVEEYLKNPRGTYTITLESRGGEIFGVGGMWVEDEIIFEKGDRVLVFLYDPTGGVYKISPYSSLIEDSQIPGNDLIKGIELRADNHIIKLNNGETQSMKLLLDSFFGYDKPTPINVAAFSSYDSDTDKFIQFEDPADLKKFGININNTIVIPNVDGTLAFDLPIAIDADAKEGKFFLELLAQTPVQSESIKYFPWKITHKQIQVIIENEN